MHMVPLEIGVNGLLLQNINKIKYLEKCLPEILNRDFS